MTFLNAALFLSGMLVAKDRPNPIFKRLERPWEIRYVLLIEAMDDFVADAEEAAKLNEKSRPDRLGRRSLNGAVLFKPTARFSVQGQREIGVVPVVFNRSGEVRNPDSLNGYKAWRTWAGRIVLTAPSQPKTQYGIAWWSQGIPGDISFSPAVCDITDDWRYEDSWTKGAIGDVGCREWTAQLYQRERPYIDVTTYTDNGNFIGSLVGWSRFGDPTKPVIGQHGKVWVCLYECPAGTRPGIIPDLRAWIARYGFPMPERPKEQPEFPDRYYLDDLYE